MLGTNGQHEQFILDPVWEPFRNKITSRGLTIGVVGLGYVGLPLAVEFAQSGFRVLGFDVMQDRVDSINAGISHVGDIGSEVLSELVSAERFEATTDMSRLAECDAISICVPTPLSKTKDPDTSYVLSATEEIAKTLRKGQLIILESTTYPGTTREIILPELERTGLSLGQDFLLAFSPERVDPGNKNYGIRNTPKVVGGMTESSTVLATALYGEIIDKVHPVSTPEAAEMVKLLENTFRAVNIGLANETALMCDRLGINVWEVIDAASTKPFGFMPFYPGPGIGGHCIPLDPFYLSWKMKTLDYRARFIELAGEVNSEMPRHVVTKIAEALNESEKSLKGSDILVLGVAYKPDIGDPRESPALDIIELLRQRGARISYSDPYVPSVRIGDHVFSSVPLENDRLQNADCVVIATNHSAFDYQRIHDFAQMVVDTRNSFEGVAVNGSNISTL